MFKVEHVNMHNAMNDIAPTISNFINIHSELSGLHTACDHNPETSAPPEKLLKKFRAHIGKIVGLTPHGSGSTPSLVQMAVPPHAKG